MSVRGQGGKYHPKERYAQGRQKVKRGTRAAFWRPLLRFVICSRDRSNIVHIRLKADTYFNSPNPTWYGSSPNDSRSFTTSSKLNFLSSNSISTATTNSDTARVKAT